MRPYVEKGNPITGTQVLYTLNVQIQSYDYKMDQPLKKAFVERALLKLHYVIHYLTKKYRQTHGAKICLRTVSLPCARNKLYFITNQDLFLLWGVKR